MSQIKVDLESVEVLLELLLACAGELLNGQAIGPGRSFGPSNGLNGAWGGSMAQEGAGAFDVLETYGSSLQDAGQNVENIAARLKLAIKHYAQAEADVVAGAQSQR